MSDHAPQPIGVCAILLNHKGEVLLGKRKNSYKAGEYGLPGGRIELNEPIEQAIQREVKEETGLRPRNFEYVGVVRENQSQHDFIHFVFVANSGNAKPQRCEPEKCEGWEWVDLPQNNRKMLQGHASAIHMYIHQQILVDLTK